jgi:hypothetical protein
MNGKEVTAELREVFRIRINIDTFFMKFSPVFDKITIVKIRIGRPNNYGSSGYGTLVEKGILYFLPVLRILNPLISIPCRGIITAPSHAKLKGTVA